MIRLNYWQRDGVERIYINGISYAKNAYLCPDQDGRVTCFIPPRDRGPGTAGMTLQQDIDIRRAVTEQLVHLFHLEKSADLEAMPFGNLVKDKRVSKPQATQTKNRHRQRSHSYSKNL